MEKINSINWQNMLKYVNIICLWEAQNRIRLGLRLGSGLGLGLGLGLGFGLGLNHTHSGDSKPTCHPILKIF